MVAKKDDRLAVIVDSCALSRLDPENMDNVYLPQSVLYEFLNGSAGGRQTNKILKGTNKTRNRIEESLDIVNNENYRQIRSVMAAAYEVAAESHLAGRDWNRILGMSREDFTDSVSGIMYHLLYNGGPKESITIKCANKTKDRDAFREQVIESLRPLIELDVFRDYKVAFSQGKDDVVFKLINGNNAQKPGVEYAFKDVEAFCERFNHQRKAKELSKKRDSILNDSQNGEYARTAKIVTDTHRERPDRIVGVDNTERGQRMWAYSQRLKQYESLLSKTIAQDASMATELRHDEFDTRKEYIEALIEEALDLYDARLKEQEIEIPHEMKEVFYYNIAKYTRVHLSGEGNGRLNSTKNDREIVAAAFAVPETEVEIWTDDNDVIELAIYANLNENLPEKKIAIRPSKRLDSPITGYMREKHRKVA